MIIAKIETFPLRIPFKPETRAAASAWGDKGLPVADSLLVKGTTDKGWKVGRGFWFSRGAVSQIGGRGADCTALHWLHRSAWVRTLRKLRHSCSKSRRSCISSGELDLRSMASQRWTLPFEILPARLPMHRLAGFWAVVLRI